MIEDASLSPASVTPPVARPADLPPGNHYATAHPSRDRAKLEAEYRYLWSVFIWNTNPKWLAEARATASWILANREMFEAVARETLIPWYVVAAINVMEMGCSFAGTILNGDPWNRVTVHYPAGKGPWSSWREAAVLGLRAEAAGWNFNLPQWKWEVGSAFFFMEAYNGFNERAEIGASIVPRYAPPYIYSGSVFYQSGKKVERLGDDGRYHGAFDPKKISGQLGTMAILQALEMAGEKIFG